MLCIFPGQDNLGSVHSMGDYRLIWNKTSAFASVRDKKNRNTSVVSKFQYRNYILYHVTICAAYAGN